MNSSRTLSLVTSLSALFASMSAIGVISSCGSSEGSPTQGVIARNPLVTADPSGTAAPGGTDVQPGVTPPGGTDGTPTDLGEGLEGLPTSTASGPVQECASSSQPTQLQGVTLVFAFDVSASMASDDDARMYKWEPVALAAKTFFSSPNSTDVSAQLTFFPSENSDTFTPTPAGGGGGGFTPPPATSDDVAPEDSAPAFPGAPPAGGGGGGIIEQQFGGEDQPACTEEEYAEPDIPLTTLPSDVFGTTIDATEPNRLGTPTRWALPAVIDQAIALRETNPSNYAVVLVTDGLPTNCSTQDDDIAGVAALAAAGPAAGIPVYVIGVDTPATSTVGAGADGIGNLNQIAVQGGTEAAFIIDTGDVDKTVADFVAVIEKIKESTFSCTMPIPPPPTGQVFDATKVNVAFKTDTQTDMVYSPDCAEQWGWHYDNETAPTAIVLCDTACTSVKSVSSTTGSVDIQFGCERRVINK
jgi:hypothetical protein